MPTITIHSIKYQNIMSNENYEYILDNLGKPLEVLDLGFYGGELVNITVKGPNYDIDKAKHGICVVLFLDSNGVSYTLDLNDVEVMRMHDTPCSNCCERFTAKHRLGGDKEPTMALLCDRCRHEIG